MKEGDVSSAIESVNDDADDGDDGDEGEQRNKIEIFDRKVMIERDGGWQCGCWVCVCLAPFEFKWIDQVCRCPVCEFVFL